jgi:hypothetical protein
MRSLRFVSAAALLAAATSPVQAQTSQGASMQRVVTTVNQSDLRLLVTMEGHTIIAQNMYTVPSVRGKTKDGLIFQLFGSGCSGSGAAQTCTNVVMQIRYDDDERVTLAGINEANFQEASVTAWWDQGEHTVGFTRFVALDGGVTFMNLRQNMRKMFVYVPTVTKYPFP